MKQYKIGVDWYFSMAAALVLTWHGGAALANAWWAWDLPGAGKWTLCLGLALLVIAYMLLDRTCRQLVEHAAWLARAAELHTNGQLRRDASSPLSQV